MRKLIVTCLAATVALSAAPPASAQEAAVYRPAGQWALDYGEDYCRLSRNFSNGNSELSLAFERIEPGPFMRMIVITDGIRTFRRAEELGWSFAPGQGERKARYAQSKMADGKDYYNFGPVTVAPFEPPAPGALPPAYDRKAEQDLARPLTAISLGSGLLSPVRIETGALDAPIAAMQGCADDLAQTWGIDAARLPGSTPPVPEGGGVGWLPQGTIPFGEFSKFVGGANQVRLMVDASGKATRCEVHWATLGDSLNKRICDTLLDKAKFAPAKDAQGNAMAGVWIGSPMFLGPPMRGPAGRR